MGRTTIVALASAAILGAACTQDFGQFTVGEVGGAGTGTGTGTGTETGTSDGGGGSGGSPTGMGGFGPGGSGGTATAMGGAGGMMPVCGDEPAPPGGTCDTDLCTNGCAGEICAVSCDQANDCSGTTIACPAGFECRIDCADGACDDLVVQCPETYACAVSCGNNECDNVTMVGTSGTTTLDCNGNTNTCTDSTINCGTGECEAACNSNEGPVTVNCGQTCNCIEGC